jgi:hypothetical protein
MSATLFSHQFGHEVHGLWIKMSVTLFLHRFGHEVRGLRIKMSVTHSCTGLAMKCVACEIK